MASPPRGAFRAAGLDLLLADLKEEALTEAQAALNAEAGAGVVRIQRCDVSEEADVDAPSAKRPSPTAPFIA